MNARKSVLPMSEWRLSVSPKGPNELRRRSVGKVVCPFSARNVGFAKNSHLASQIALRQLGKQIESITLGSLLCGGASLGRDLPHVDRCRHISALSVLYYKEPFPVFRSFELQRCFFSIFFACFAPELLSEIKTGQVVFV